MFPLLIKAVKAEGLKAPEKAILIQIGDLTKQQIVSCRLPIIVACSEPFFTAKNMVDLCVSNRSVGLS